MLKIKMSCPYCYGTAVNYYISKYGGKVLNATCGVTFSTITFLIDNYNDIHTMMRDFGRAGCKNIIILKVKEVKKRWWNKWTV